MAARENGQGVDKGVLANRSVFFCIPNEVEMTDASAQNDRIRELETELADLKAQLPRMLSIMLRMQAHLEQQQAHLAQRPRRPSAPAKPPSNSMTAGWSRKTPCSLHCADRTAKRQLLSFSILVFVM